MARIREFQQQPFAGLYMNAPKDDEVFRRIVRVLRRCPGLTEREIRDAISGGARRSTQPRRSRWRDRRQLLDVRRGLEVLHYAGYVAYQRGTWVSSSRFRDPAFAPMMRDRIPWIPVFVTPPAEVLAGDPPAALDQDLSEGELSFLRAVRHTVAKLRAGGDGGGGG